MNQTTTLLKKWAAQDKLNFWLTNRIPRAFFTRLMGKISRLQSPLVAHVGIWIWRKFSDLDLTEAEQSKFNSIHDCFTRRLKPGSRPFDNSPKTLCSPCDAIIGAHGTIEHGKLLQAKGMVYQLSDLMQSHTDAALCEGYQYVTLRLTSSMYHHFHAPVNLCVKSLRYIHGDVWNVNPPTLKRISSLFAKNERAVIEVSLSETEQTMWMIPVAAVLVASMRFTFSDLHLHLGYRGPTQTDLNAKLTRGDDMGWFEHGSTIICLIPPDWKYSGPETGQRIKTGQSLFTLD